MLPKGFASQTPLTLLGWQAALSRAPGEAREPRGDLARGEASAGAAPRFREDFPAGVWVTLTGKTRNNGGDNTMKLISIVC